MLTVNTHAPNGFRSESCKSNEENEYLNSVVCSSKEISKFIKWLKEQDFYKNTTIVLVGDHLSMNSIISENIEYENRQIYNAIINSPIKIKCEKERSATSFDMYPTTLASIGAKIEGNRLGLGTNLYSCEKTLSEKYGIINFNEELSKNSTYYTKCIFSNKC